MRKAFIGKEYCKGEKGAIVMGDVGGRTRNRVISDSGVPRVWQEGVSFIGKSKQGGKGWV